MRLARQFFADRGVLEVDCGALVQRAPIDANINVLTVALSKAETAFLHTSPEYAMKRLLSAGAPDIFFLGHVFRKEEIGRLHSLEFTMAEWYRVGMSFQDMIQETCAFLFLFFGEQRVRLLSYADAFAQYAGELPSHASEWSKKEQAHYILAHHIEPHLGQDELTVLIDYPPEEAALACVVEKKGKLVAERFEIYYQGVELTNGYHELSDADELRCRFDEENRQRQLRGEEPYLLDEEFLASVERLPDCCGVSVGFDRALMLQQKKPSLHDVQLKNAKI